MLLLNGGTGAFGGTLLFEAGCALLALAGMLLSIVVSQHLPLNPHHFADLIVAPLYPLETQTWSWHAEYHIDPRLL